MKRNLERAHNGKASAQDRHRGTVLETVAEKVVAKKQDLLWYFSQLDPEGSGWISLQQWREGMDAVLGLRLAWRDFENDLVCPQDGWVDYSRFCRRYRVAYATVKDTKWQAEARRTLFEAVMRADLKADSAIEMFQDTKLTDRQLARQIEGRVTGQSIGLTSSQLESVVSHVRSTGKKARTAAEFAEHFATSLAMGSPRKDDSKLQILGQIMHSYPGSSSVLFNEFDTNADGFLQFDEFVNAVTALQNFNTAEENVDIPKLSPDELLEVCDEIDAGRTGHINYLEFCAAFYSEEHNDMVTELMHQLHATFFENKIGLRRAFRYFDINEDGTVTPAELKAGLEALNSLLSKHGSPMSEAQIGAIAAHLDRNEDGMIDYQEFLDGFKVIDAGVQE